MIADCIRSVWIDLRIVVLAHAVRATGDGLDVAARVELEDPGIEMGVDVVLDGLTDE